MVVELPHGVQIGIRGVEPELDYPFIFNSWMRHIRNAAIFDKFNAEDFRKHKQSVVEPLVESSSVLVAHDPADAEHIYGYCVFAGDVLHALYVKGRMRGFGIGSALLHQAFPELGARPLWSTYKGEFSRLLRDKYRFGYDPYRVIGVAI